MSDSFFIPPPTISGEDKPQGEKPATTHSEFQKFITTYPSNVITVQQAILYLKNARSWGDTISQRYYNYFPDPPRFKAAMEHAKDLEKEIGKSLLLKFYAAGDKTTYYKDVYNTVSRIYEEASFIENVAKLKVEKQKEEQKKKDSGPWGSIKNLAIAVVGITGIISITGLVREIRKVKKDSTDKGSDEE